MQLDKFTDYGLRILMALAVHRPEKLSVAAISRMFDVSENHLSKVATELAREGFIVSERGRAGGLRLANHPSVINVGAVVRRLKRDNAVAECFSDKGSCCIFPGCGLRGPLSEAEEAFFAVLDRYSLQDVTVKRDVLEGLLARP